MSGLIGRLKDEGSYDADNNIAIFGAPRVFAELGEVPAYNYIVLDGRLEFIESDQNDIPPTGKYIWILWGFEKLEQALDYIRGQAFTTLYVLDDGVYTEALPQFTIIEDGLSKRVSPSVAYYTSDGAERSAEDRRVYVPCLCEVQLLGITYCFLAQAMDDIYEHLSCGPLCDIGQPNGVVDAEGTFAYEGKCYTFALKWENGHGWVELKDENGFLYDAEKAVFADEPKN
ncbi:MAG: hypothetical protein IKK92_10410 [Prevotella sp.]|nr:hypothetical protein [Prevotella sp.]